MIKNPLLKLYWKDRQFKIVFLIVLGWIGSVITFLIPVSIGAFFDIQYQSITNRGKLLQMLGLHFETTYSFFVFFFSIILSKMILDFLERKSVVASAERFVHNINYRLFKTQINWPSHVFHQKPYGNYIMRYSGDMQSIRNLIVRGLHSSIKDFLFLVTGFFILYLLNQLLTLLVIGFAIILFPSIYFLDKKQQPYIADREKRKNRLVSFVTHSFSQFDQIRENAQEKEIITQFRKKLKRLFEAKQSFEWLESVRLGIIQSLGYLIVGMLLFQVAYQNIIISSGELLVYILVLLPLLSSFRRLMKSSATWQKGLISLNNKQLLFSKVNEVKESEKSEPDSM